MAYKRAEVVGTTLVEGTLETGSQSEKQQAFGSCLFVSEGNQFEMIDSIWILLICVTDVVGEVCKIE